MIDHVTLYTKDYKKSKEFYKKILAPLGYKIESDYKKWKVIGMGSEGRSDLWLYAAGVKQKSHFAFVAKNKVAVQKFYETALKAGAKDNGKPGYRENYTPDYYAAFITDINGHNIEAVFRDRSRLKKKKKK